MMSRRKVETLRKIPVDSEKARAIIVGDNPGYIMTSLEKEYREEVGQWYFFARLELAKNDSVGGERGS